MRKRRGFTPEYKARIILEVLAGEKTISELASRESLNTNQIGNWKREFLENAGRVFAQGQTEKEATQTIREFQEKERRYQEKVGQLTLEVDFLKKKSEGVCGPGWEARHGYKG